jgi:hypothetical protein
MQNLLHCRNGNGIISIDESDSCDDCNSVSSWSIPHKRIINNYPKFPKLRMRYYNFLVSLMRCGIKPNVPEQLNLNLAVKIPLLRERHNAHISENSDNNAAQTAVCEVNNLASKQFLAKHSHLLFLVNVTILAMHGLLLTR